LQSQRPKVLIISPVNEKLALVKEEYRKRFGCQAKLFETFTFFVFPPAFKLVRADHVQQSGPIRFCVLHRIMQDTGLAFRDCLRTIKTRETPFVSWLNH
jgi:hypothetical protein